MNAISQYETPEEADGEAFDLIVLGAGIYGLCLHLEACRRGLRSLLIEKRDFGGATSLNSLRILHGGLRYLQSLDLPRFIESNQQRNWFLDTFPDFCRPLSCLMPLYGEGLKRRSVFRTVFALSNVVAQHPALPRSQTLNPQETLERFPAARRQGLEGSALWHDGQILSPQRLHVEILRWAAQLGGSALNYASTTCLVTENESVVGVETNRGAFKCPIVLNAAGPWARELASKLESDLPNLIIPSLAFNLALNRPPPSDCAVAVQGERMYFVTPHQRGITFAGTLHKAWKGRGMPNEEEIEAFLAGLNDAIPGWELKMSDILRITPGVLPAKALRSEDTARRSRFVAHQTKGLYSVCGIKYTTAPGFAAKTIRRLYGKRTISQTGPKFGDRIGYVDPQSIIDLDDSKLAALARAEAATTPEDFLERRMDWIIDAKQHAALEKRLAALGLRNSCK